MINPKLKVSRRARFISTSIAHSEASLYVIMSKGCSKAFIEAAIFFATAAGLSRSNLFPKINMLPAKAREPAKSNDTR